ncbi:MAG: YceI family protein [Anaerolineae bacterium]
MSRSLISILFILAALGLTLAACNAPAAPAAPPAVTLAPTAPTGTPATSIGPAPTGTPAGSSPASSAGGSSATAKIVLVPDKSTANYRVREQLAGVDLPSDAVGKTSAISGQIVGKTDGTIDASQSSFTVDLRTLKSDQSMRDGYIQGAVLQTRQYPNAVFVLKSTDGLTMPLPASGTVSFKLLGDLTVRDTTKPVTWDVTCQVTGDSGTCSGKTTFTFAYFNLTKPSVGRVLSIEDNIALEFNFAFQRAQ